MLQFTLFQRPPLIEVNDPFVEGIDPSAVPKKASV